MLSCYGLSQLWALLRLCCTEPAELPQSFSNQRIGLMLRTFCHWVKEGRREEKMTCFNSCTGSAYKKKNILHGPQSLWRAFVFIVNYVRFDVHNETSPVF